MRYKNWFAALVVTSLPTLCEAWFIFIPGKLIEGVADAISGAEGQHCVGASAKIGDKIRLPGGGTATVKSLSGTAVRCGNPEHPIRALLDFGDTTQVTGGVAGQPSPSRQPFQRPPEHSLSDPFSNPHATTFAGPPPSSVQSSTTPAPQAPSPATAPAALQSPTLVPVSASQQSDPSATPTAASRASLVDRLKQLELLRKEGLVSEDEYQQKRKKLLEEL